MKIRVLFLVSLCFLGIAGCSRNIVDDTPGRPTTYEDIGTPGQVSGIGIESQDIASMTDRMMRDMLSNETIAGRQIAPYVIIDEQYFSNESSSRINKKLITERLLVSLNRAANGRIVFIERAAAEMVEKERMLKREGIVSKGTTGTTEKTAGADFQLTGKIMSLDSADTKSGAVSRYHQISFKMINLETGVIAWSGSYEFKKTAQDDLITR